MFRKNVYKQEFFDREYSAKEAYGRLWSFARKAIEEYRRTRGE